MSVEPERPIEKVLRAFARKRRDETRSSLELHPATRRMLQSEVARQYAKAKSEPRWWFGLGARFWPRVAVGLAGSAVLVVGLWLVATHTPRQKPETLLAKNERMAQGSTIPHSRALQEPAPALIAPQTESRLNDSKQKLAEETADRDEAVRMNSKERDINERSLAAAAPVEQQAGQQATAAPFQAEAKRQEVESLSSDLTRGSAVGGKNALVPGQYGVAVQNSPTAPAAPSSSLTSLALVDERQTSLNSAQFQAVPAPALAFGDGARLGATNAFFRSYFVSVAQQNAKLKDRESAGQRSSEPVAKAALLDKTSPGNLVLTSFEVEQSSQGLRVVDQDNSVYTGILETRAQADARSASSASSRLLQELTRKTQVRSSTPNTTQSPGPGPEYFFKVAGTNRSLNQRVVFSGRLVPNMNPTSFKPVSALSSAAERGQTKQEPGLSPFLDKRIVGTAVIGEGREVPIDALPVPAQKQNR